MTGKSAEPAARKPRVNLGLYSLSASAIGAVTRRRRHLQLSNESEATCDRFDRR